MHSIFIFQICDIISQQLVLDGHLNEENANKLKDLWQRKHRHQFEGPRKVEGTLTRVLKDLIVQKLESKVGTVIKASDCLFVKMHT